jgi:DNA polymerase III delta prime subunit
MTTTLMKNYLWVEKYRPQNINDCILPESIKTTFKQMVDSGEVQNLLLSGGAGCGKTTIAKALCKELDADYIMINCSEDGNIDTLRTKIRNFASSISISGGKKVVILDEFDYANAQSMQPALRGFIEEFSKNCRFILTCNFKNRIIEPIHSRCTSIEFSIPNKSKPKLASMFLERCSFILEEEGINYNEKVLAELILKHFPDFRRIINELQRYSVAGEIDIGILNQIGELHINDLMTHMKEKNFIEVRKWVVQNLDNDSVQLFRKIYDSLYDYLKAQSIPQAVLILADYQYKDAFVADSEINTTAALVEIMVECEFE